MNICLFGATGMVGQSVLRECLSAQDVQRVVCVGRSAPDNVDAKLYNVLTPDLTNLDSVQAQLSGFDACFFCLGVSSVGMEEAQYTKLTYDLTMGIARVLRRLNPNMVFVYVTGAGTDSTELGRRMWARVKGKTENDLIQLGFKGAYMLRPGVIQPLHAVRSKTALYQLAYVVAKPIFAIMNLIKPHSFVTSVDMGQVMLALARHGYSKPLLEIADIKSVAQRALHQY